MVSRGKNRQLAINMLASLSTFVVGLGIRFFLTPYIVGRLGREAYGFIGLAANILSYTGLLTIALNSMAGRFVTVKYTAGKVDEANKYYASVFYSNLFLATVILMISAGCLIWLEYIINIPVHMVWDVKILFALIAINDIVALLTNIWGVATFIKNRIELSNIRGIIGSFMNAAILVGLFAFFAPHIWYMGVAGFVMTLYGALTNRGFARMLTPDLQIKLSNFEWAKVRELIGSGVWNLISRFGEIVGHEVDLLLTNLYIGPSAMGLFALTRGVPGLILSFFASLSGAFSPMLTALWAQGRKTELQHELLKSVRILGFFSNIPLAGLVVFGDALYSLWLPTEDAQVLQLITIVASAGSVLSMPYESLWGIFTITNRLRVSSLTMLGMQCAIFGSWIIGLPFMHSDLSGLLLLCGIRTFWNMMKSLFFLPLYGAYCMGFRSLTFYAPLVKSVMCFILSCAIGFIIKSFVVIDSWFAFFAICSLTAIVWLLANFYLVLQKDDRQFIINRFLKRRMRA